MMPVWFCYSIQKKVRNTIFPYLSTKACRKEKADIFRSFTIREKLFYNKRCCFKNLHSSFPAFLQRLEVQMNQNQRRKELKIRIKMRNSLLRRCGFVMWLLDFNRSFRGSLCSNAILKGCQEGYIYSFRFFLPRRRAFI